MAARKAKDFSGTTDQQMELVARYFHALSDPTRLKVLRELKSGEKSVQDLCGLFTCSQPNISRHLSILTSSGLVRKDKRGSFALYRVTSHDIFELCDHVCSHVNNMIERLAGR
jgi:DNA-binding transcriptional ArsR family regulator